MIERESFIGPTIEPGQALRQGNLKKRIVSKTIFWASRHVILTHDRSAIHHPHFQARTALYTHGRAPASIFKRRVCLCVCARMHLCVVEEGHVLQDMYQLLDIGTSLSLSLSHTHTHTHTHTNTHTHI